MRRNLLASVMDVVDTTSVSGNVGPCSRSPGIHPTVRQDLPDERSSWPSCSMGCGMLPAWDRPEKQLMDF
jgi:hypothetical protein